MAGFYLKVGRNAARGFGCDRDVRAEIGSTRRRQGGEPPARRSPVAYLPSLRHRGCFTLRVLRLRQNLRALGMIIGRGNSVETVKFQQLIEPLLFAHGKW